MKIIKASVVAAGLLVLGSAANASTCNGGSGFFFGHSSGCYSTTVSGHSSNSGHSFYQVMQRVLNVGSRLSVWFGQHQTAGGLSWVASNPQQVLVPTSPQGPVSEVPLPASALLLLGGLGGMAVVRKRKKS